MDRLLSRVDHLVLATPDLEATLDRLERDLGCRAIPGGSHPAWATRNALLGLGERCYLEILGPDREAPAPATPRPLGLDGLRTPRLATWAAAGAQLEEIVARAAEHGVELGEVRSGSRRRPDGIVLRWRMTDLTAQRLDGMIPFFVDWGETPHPAATAPRAGDLLSVRMEHPEPARVEAALAAVGLDHRVLAGAAPRLVAVLQTPRGRMELS